MKFTVEVQGGDEDDIALALWPIGHDIEDGETSGTLNVNDHHAEWSISAG